MGKIMMALLVGGFGLGLAQAQEPAQVKQPEMKKEAAAAKKMKAKVNVFRGTVEAVDPALGTLTVKDKKGMVMVLPIAPETRIMKAGKTATLAGIMAGDKVLVKYEGPMESPVVKMVKVTKPLMKEKGMKRGPKVEEPQM